MQNTDVLEIKISYLELKYEELNEVVIAQDKEIQRLKGEIKVLEKKVSDLEEVSGVDRPNRRPPHY